MRPILLELGSRCLLPLFPCSPPLTGSPPGFDFGLLRTLSGMLWVGVVVCCWRHGVRVPGGVLKIHDRYRIRESQLGRWYRSQQVGLCGYRGGRQSDWHHVNRSAIISCCLASPIVLFL